MTEYKISPSGVDRVVKDVGNVIEHDLTENLKDIRDVLESAVENIVDPASPVMGAVQWLLLGAAGEIRSVATATSLVVGAGVRATNAYIEADDLMARTSGAREAASNQIGSLDHAARHDRLNRSERISLDQWIANQQGLQP